MATSDIMVEHDESLGIKAFSEGRCYSNEPDGVLEE